MSQGLGLAVSAAIRCQRHGRLLIMQRSLNDSFLPGYWELPGGACEPGEPPRRALEREIWEETGIEIDGDKARAFHAFDFEGPSYYEGAVFTLIVYEVITNECVVPVMTEHRAYKHIHPLSSTEALRALPITNEMWLAIDIALDRVPMVPGTSRGSLMGPGL